MRSILFCLSLVLCLAAAVFAQQEHPNFSGTWKMNPDKSDFGRFSVPASITRVVTMQEPDLTIATTQRGASGEQTSEVHYRTDGSETTNQLSNGPGKSHAFWDGNTLVVRTTMKTSSNVDVLMEERWTLSEDKNELTAASHIETSRGGTDLTLVCEREK